MYAISEKFKKLYSKRAYVHWSVGQGMEEEEFNKQGKLEL